MGHHWLLACAVLQKLAIDHGCLFALAATMAQGEPAGFGYWIGVLVRESGLAFRDEVPRDQRVLFRKLARFLVENEFEHVRQLRKGQWHVALDCGMMLHDCVVSRV